MDGVCYAASVFCQHTWQKVGKMGLNEQMELKYFLIFFKEM